MICRPAPVRFTDEELLLLGAEHPVVDMPFVCTLDAEGRQLAAQVAYRSLCCHGAVPAGHGSGLEVPEAVVDLLRARATAATVLVVGRATPTAGVLRYHHVGSHGVVVEDVTDDGTHAFRQFEHGDLAADLRDFCATRGVVEGRGEPIALTEEAFVAGEHGGRLWGEGIAQFNATVWRCGPSAEGEPDAVRSGASIVFVLGTRGSWWGHRGDTADGPAVELTPIAPSSVSSVILRELLPDPQSAGREDDCPLIGA